MKTEHTPIPWDISSSCLICNEEGKILANLIPLGLMELDVTLDEAVANAEFIVKAVNNHDKLVEILRQTKDNLTEILDFLTNEPDKADCVIQRSRACIKSALVNL